MRLRATLDVLAAGAAWRLGHPRWAGRALVGALGEADETARTLAGMLLAKGGAHATPLVREALARRENPAMVLAVAASIADPSLEADVRRYADDPDPQVAAAARDALRLIGRAKGGKHTAR